MPNNKTIQFKNSLKFKVPAPIVLGAIILSAVLFVIAYDKYTSQMDVRLVKNFKVFEELFLEQLSTKEQDVIMSMETMLTNDSLVAAFASGDRDALVDMMLPIYNNKLKTEHDIVQFQFHTPPATSFLRLHKPSKFGDDLSSFRETVIEANQNKNIVSGIEVGRGGPGLRIVFPVDKNGNHIGTVEFGLGLNNILQGINKALNVEYAIGIKKEVFEKARRFDTKETDVINNDVIFYNFSDDDIKSLVANELLNKEVKRFNLEGKDFASFTFPIYDFAKNEAGFIILYSDITNDIAQMYSSLSGVVLIVLLLSLSIAAAMYYILNRKVISPLDKMSSAAEAFAAGDKNVDFHCDSTDELGYLSSSLELMATKINTQLQYLDNLPTPVTIMDNDFNIQYINAAAADFSGIEKDNAVGRKCSELFNTPHCGTDQCGCLQAMNKNEVITSEAISDTNNRKRPIMYTGAPIKNDQGEVIGAMESAAEITDIKNKEDYLARSTQMLLSAMDRFSNGDLTVTVNAENKNDDIGKLFSGFNLTVDKIKNLINKLSDAITATASASTQISSSAEELAAGSQEQSTQTADVASAVEEMAVTVLETTKNVTIAADSAREAGETAAGGGKVIGNTINGIENISKVVTRAASAVELLGSSSEKIGDIVGVIDDIAEQTNLLALNAAIEAARAGEHGRGFAVVADEVGKLAERTINATKEISQTIENIQKETNKAVVSIREGKVEAEKGKDYAAEANNSLELIINKTDTVIEQINQVATASEEQASTAEQVSKNIEIINSVGQESAMGVQQIAVAAEDLNRLTEQLQDLVSMFNVEDANFQESYSYNSTNPVIS